MLMTLITFMLNIKYSWMSGCTKRSAVVDEDYDVVHIKYQVFGCLVIQTNHRHRHWRHQSHSPWCFWRKRYKFLHLCNNVMMQASVFILWISYSWAVLFSSRCPQKPKLRLSVTFSSRTSVRVKWHQRRSRRYISNIFKYAFLLIIRVMWGEYFNWMQKLWSHTKDDVLCPFPNLHFWKGSITSQASSLATDHLLDGRPGIAARSQWADLNFVFFLAIVSWFFLSKFTILQLYFPHNFQYEQQFIFQPKRQQQD